MFSRRQQLLDGALAGTAAAALIVDGVLGPDRGLGGAVALCAIAIATGGVLVWRRRFPVPVLIASMGGVIACVTAYGTDRASVAVALIPLYTVAVLGDRRRSLVVAVFTTLLLVATTAALEGTLKLTEGAVRLLLLLSSLVVGEAVRSRGELRAATQERTARALEEREEAHRRSLAEERIRIARDLHDSLAHALVAINVRAGVAAHLGDAGDGAGALSDIKALSAEALGDLRATLGLLRDQNDPAPTGPSLDLNGLPELVDRVRAAGLDTAASIDVAGAAIPSPVGQAGFRIVQESLTNVLRHAHAARARVTVGVTAGNLVIDVVDDGRGGTGAAGGHGLRGMRERAAALGGRVDSGPDAGGGWRVHASLPLAAGVAP